MNISIRFDGERYEVAVPNWKHERQELPPNQQMEEKRLHTVEKKLMQHEKQNGKSLNTESLPGPKLQTNIADVLVKFRKEPVAMAGDVSQMYNQMLLRPGNRPLHRFLYRNLGTGDTPKVYKFKRFIFGGCYCPLCVQFAWQHHARLNKETYS